MAEATPAKKKRVQGPRTMKPLFVIVRAYDENGTLLQFNAPMRVEVQIERNSDKLLEALIPGGSGLSASAVVRAELPQGPPRKKADAAETQATS